MKLDKLGRPIRKKHGLSHTSFYFLWAGMVARCENPRHRYYKNYGGRGIAVCPKWRRDAGAFHKDMFSSYRPGLSIERKNNNGNYTPKNCRWSTRKEQMNNTRTNRFLVVRGVKRTISQWSDISGIHYQTLTSRIKAGWKPADCVDRKPQSCGRSP